MIWIVVAVAALIAYAWSCVFVGYLRRLHRVRSRRRHRAEFPFYPGR